MRSRRTAVLLTLLAAAAPGSLAAQSEVTITADLLDRYLAAYAAADARAQSMDVQVMDGFALQDAEDQYEECVGEVEFSVATTSEKASVQRMQQEMQKYMNDLENPRYAALVDSATAIMRGVSERAGPKVREKCGASPSEQQEAEIQAMNEAQAEFSFDTEVQTALGMDEMDYILLVEKLYLYLDAETPKPNDLWSADELRVLASYRGRLAAALN